MAVPINLVPINLRDTCREGDMRELNAWMIGLLIACSGVCHASMKVMRRIWEVSAENLAVSDMTRLLVVNSPVWHVALVLTGLIGITLILLRRKSRWACLAMSCIIFSHFAFLGCFSIACLQSFEIWPLK